MRNKLLPLARNGIQARYGTLNRVWPRTTSVYSRNYGQNYKFSKNINKGILPNRNSDTSKIPSPIASESKRAACKVIYDGSCPVCSKTMDSLNFEAELIDARQGGETVKALEAKGYDFDKGMAVIDEEGNVQYGADAVKKLASEQGGVLDKIFNSSITDTVYPFFRSIRNLLVDESIAEQRAKETVVKPETPSGPK